MLNQIAQARNAMREQENGPKIMISNAAVEMEVVNESGTATSLKINENIITTSNQAEPRASASLILSPSMIAFDTYDNLNLNDTSNSAFNLMTNQGNMDNIEVTGVVTKNTVSANPGSSMQTNIETPMGNASEPRETVGSAQPRNDSDSESEHFFNNFNIKRFSSTRRDLD
jgi:hypothetical protein